VVYGLKLEYFVINPKTEYQVFFVRDEEFRRFLGDLNATIDSGRIPHYVIFGWFGLGKTQSLLHLRHELNSKADSVYVVTPSCHRRTRFVEFYRSIVNAMGRQTVIDMLTKGINLVQQNRKQISEIGLSEELTNVVSKAVDTKQQFLLWRFIVGQKLSASEAAGLEAVKRELSDEDAAVILEALAVLNLEFNKRPLLLLIDEFEHAAEITGDAKNTFTEAIRTMVDEGSHVGVVFALTGRSMGEFPSSVADDSVRRRIGITNYISFKEYTEVELEQFITQVISYRRDKQFDVKKAVSSIHIPETVTEATYPFTREAIDEIVRSVVLFKEQGKIDAVRPKEALEIMDKGLRMAIDKKSPAIEKDFILSVRDQVVEALSL
jgi:Cdc6-like AAA superfamily ATPase